MKICKIPVPEHLNLFFNPNSNTGAPRVRNVASDILSPRMSALNIFNKHLGGIMLGAMHRRIYYKRLGARIIMDSNTNKLKYQRWQKPLLALF